MGASFELANGDLTLSRSVLGEEFHISNYEEYKKAFLKILRVAITEDTYIESQIMSKQITNMPTGFSSPLTVHFWRNGKPIDGNFSISIDFVAVFAKKSPAYAYGTPLTTEFLGVLCDEGDRLEGQLLHQRLEGIGPRKAVRVGSCKHTARGGAT